MKAFVIIIICLLLIIAGALLGVFLSGLNNKKYNLMVIGDQGQFEYFKKTYDEVSSLAELSNQEKINRIFKDTVYYVGEGRCYIKTASKAMELTDLTKQDSRDEGMKNFGELSSTPNFKTYLEAASGIVFIGDSVYPEDKKLAEVGANKNAVLGSPDKWNDRLTCGWNIFTAHLKDLNLIKDNETDERVFMLTGNHSYDVSFNKEEQIVKGLENPKEHSAFYEWDEKKEVAVVTSNKTPTNYSYVRKVTIYNGRRTITFVDINTAPLVCLDKVKNEAEYNDSKICSFDEYLIQRWSYSQVVNYYLTIYDLVKNLDKSHWNVIRGHHPPTNYVDGDSTFYWDVSINGQVYNLMTIFEERNVRIFLGSHTHGGGVMTIPFRKTAMRPRGSLIIAEKQGSYCNVNNLKASSEELMNVQTVCNTSTFNVDLEKEKLMLVFITGNSGRMLDPVADGLRSARGNTVWADKMTYTVSGVTKDSYGFSNAEFDENILTFKFFAMKFVENIVDTSLMSTFEVKFDEASIKNLK